MIRPAISLLSSALLILLLRSPSLFAAEYVEGLDHWPVLPLERALETGLEKNLDLRIEAISIPIGRENIRFENAQFDPALKALAEVQEQKIPTSSAFTGDPFTRQRSYDVEIGLDKRFRFGLESNLSLRSSRTTNNSTIEGLDPQYRTLLVLDLNQPLMRDRGRSVNTTDRRLATNTLAQAKLATLRRAQSLAADIETAYYDLGQTIQIYTYRIESRDLARQLLAANQEKFKAGLIPITEVQEAQTAVAARDEMVLAARQALEESGNRLKDLLGLRLAYPMSRNFFRTAPLPGPDQPYPQLEEALSQALQRRPDLKRLQLDVAGRNIRVEYFKNQKLPKLDLKTTFSLNGLSGEERSIEFAGVSSGANPQSGEYFDSVERMSEGDGYEWFAGIEFTYPLDNRAAEARYRRSGWEKRQAIYTLKRTETTIETDVINGMITVKRSLERVKVARRFEELAEITMKQEMERLREGLSDTFRILRFQDDVIEARIREVTAVGDFNRGLAALYHAMGSNLERLNISYQVPVPEDNHESN